MLKQRFDIQKAIEVLLYITSTVQNKYNALKVLYFADKEHLRKYGRLICGESYIAMSHGPVPSGSYDIVKYASGENYINLPKEIIGFFKTNDNDISPLRKANPNFLSESDKECLDESISTYGSMSFVKLKRLSHDEAYKSADHNDVIPLEAIIRALPNAKELLDYLEITED